MAERYVHELLRSPLIAVLDVVHPDLPPGHRRSETVARGRLVLPYRGSTLHRIAGDEVVADASQVLFSHAGETCEVSQLQPGGDARLELEVDEAMLREIAPAGLLRVSGSLRFQRRRLRIDPRAQVLVALLRHSLREQIADPLEGESLALTLVQRSLGARTAHTAGASPGRQRLVERAKQVLARDLARRWTLSEVAGEVGVSPVYLTQSFRAVEGVPLYRYQLRLRLARALDLIGDYEDLGALAHDLGFSSHSHFSMAFHQAYRRTPSEFRGLFLRRRQRAGDR